MYAFQFLNSDDKFVSQVSGYYASLEHAVACFKIYCEFDLKDGYMQEGEDMGELGNVRFMRVHGYNRIARLA